MTDEELLTEIATKYIPCVGDIEDELETFFNSEYTIIKLEENGIIGYTEHIDYYVIEFAYNGGLHKNTKTLYNIAKRLSNVKPVLYTGIKNHYSNNSTSLGNGVFKINIGV